MFNKREIYKDRFPGWSQHFITWLTGVPFKGQRPLIRSNPYLELMATVAWFGIAVGLGAMACYSVEFISIV